MLVGQNDIAISQFTEKPETIIDKLINRKNVTVLTVSKDTETECLAFLLGNELNNELTICCYFCFIL